jgi:glutathione synthase/RimK-type ligase-like ATP-grasp enzyme
VIALVTVASARHLDADLPLLSTALAERGATSVVVEWDDESVEWSQFSLVVIRSTWDYQNRLGEFLDWVEHVSKHTRVVNPPEVVRWNTDKRYLRDLAAAGVATVPTTFVLPGQSFEAPTDRAFVVKPAVSAGANDTERYRTDQAAEAAAHSQRLLDAGRVVMVQPYVDSVDLRGETGLIYFAGEFSHSIRKGPILVPGVSSVEGLYAEEDISARPPSPAELELAERVLRALPAAAQRPAYARIDVVDGDAGPMVLEVELTEPSLFLAHAPGSADRLAATLMELAGI